MRRRTESKSHSQRQSQSSSHSQLDIPFSSDSARFYETVTQAANRPPRGLARHRSRRPLGHRVA